MNSSIGTWRIGYVRSLKYKNREKKGEFNRFCIEVW